MMASVQDVSVIPQTGWDRIKKFYNLKEVCLEREIVIKTVKMSFITTFVLGGLIRREEINRRVQMYTTAVTFGSPSLRLSRTWDYKLLAFMRNGLRWGIRASALVGTITMLSSHLILYRDRFSAWYFPTISGVLSLVGHRALATGMFALPMGASGCVQALALGTIIGSTVSGTVYLYALYIDGTVDEAYKKYRALCEEELRDLRVYQSKIARIVKEKNLTFAFQGRKYLEQTEHDDTLGTLDTFDDPVEAPNKK